VQVPIERHLEYSIPEPTLLGELVAHFYIYGDESGKLGSSDCTSFCGYVGPAPEVERVSAEWNSARFAWQIPPLHMRCVMFPERDKSGEWERVRSAWGAGWEQRRTDMLKEFASILLQANLVCVGCVAEARHFDQMPDSKFKRDMEDPMFLSLYMLIMNSIDKVERVDRTGSPIGIVLDDDEEYAVKCYKLLNAMKKHYPKVKQRISAITFGDDHAYPALQMADFIAYEARARMLDQLSDANSKPSVLYMALTRKMLHQPVLCLPEHLELLAKDWPSV
jgi:hypothetical protein